ncbi:MAG: restriction endonuclease subunit S [Tannerella sp.]|jgi:type I restriction enzyme S subunit|nr:restriction endonuclease subunit S [Tannerella sp.]
MNKVNYKRLGDYIREVDVRNDDGGINTLLGINIDKFFMPSVANVVGTDLTLYKVVDKNQFACNRMHVGRDKRLPVALSTKEEKFIVSPAYDVFEIIDKQKLLPDYLMMWFSRAEFDRNTWFYTDADVRGGLSWNTFSDMQLPVPLLEKQHEIVNEYNAIQNRIDLNSQLIQKLEETAQAIYKQWFVDFEFPDENDKSYKSNGGEMVESEMGEIPKGWRVTTVQDFCIDMKSGGTPNRDIMKFWNSKDIPWLKTGEIHNNIVYQSEEYISEEGFKSSSAKKLPKDTVLMAMYGATAGQLGILKFEACTNQACCGMICENPQQSAYLYYSLLYNQEFIKSQAIGGAQENLSKNFIEKLPILKPTDNILNDDIFKTITNDKEILTLEIDNLEILAELLLSKMAKGR